jgi:hypothetical protein
MVADGLRGLGLEIQTHDQHFGQSTKDEEWIPVIGEYGWPVLTNDKNILSRPIALKAYKAAGVRLFVLAKKGYSTADSWVQIIERHLKSILVLAAYAPPPFLAKITEGNVTFRWRGDSLDQLPPV